MLRGLIKKLQRRRATGEPIEPTPPSALAAKKIAEEIVSPDLRVNVFQHSMNSSDGPLTCWTYVSQGLWALGQKELMFSVKQEAEENEGDYPRGLLRLYELVRGFALKEQFVDVGGFSTLDPESAGLLGRTDFLGVAYSIPQHFDGVEVPSPSLTALVLTTEETKVAQTFGLVRVMSILGSKYRFYPTAPWADRRRPQLVTMEEMQNSVLARTHRVFAPGAVSYLRGRKVGEKKIPKAGRPDDTSLQLEDQRIVLELAPRARERLKQIMDQLPDDSPIALLTEPDPHANACLCMGAGTDELRTIGLPDSPNSRIAGNCVIFAPGIEEVKGGVIEDGFSFILDAETWSDVRRALTTGQSGWYPPTGEGLGLEIVWRPESYQDPITGSELVASDGWSVLRPNAAQPVEPEAGFSRLEGTVLLIPEEQMAQRVRVEALGDFCRAVAGTVEAWASHSHENDKVDLVVECEVQPDGATQYELGLRPLSHNLDSRILHSRLEELPRPSVQRGPIKFQLLFTLWGGSGTKML